MAYETITVDTEDHIALIKLNRPDALNALNLRQATCGRDTPAGNVERIGLFVMVCTSRGGRAANSFASANP